MSTSDKEQKCGASIETVSLLVEIQQNGIIRNEKGRLIARLVDDIEYKGEHVKGVASTTDSEGWDWENEFDEKYKISDSTYSFDTIHEINESDISELKSFISKVASQARIEGAEDFAKQFKDSQQCKEMTEELIHSKLE